MLAVLDELLFQYRGVRSLETAPVTVDIEPSTRSLVGRAVQTAILALCCWLLSSFAHRCEEDEAPPDSIIFDEVLRQMFAVKTIGTDESRWELMDTVLHHSNNAVAIGIAWGFTSVTPYGARVASVEVLSGTGDDGTRESPGPVSYTHLTLPTIYAV